MDCSNGCSTDRVPGQPVYIHHRVEGRLLAWGRPGSPPWWALVVWQQRIHIPGGRRPGDPDQLAMAAWVPADAVQRPLWAVDEPVLQLELPPLREFWPRPARWSGWWAGLWEDGELVPHPEGVEVVLGGARSPRLQRW